MSTLVDADLDGDIDRWAGSESRTTFIWKPKLSPRDYMSGLIRYCNNRDTFVFGIWSLEEKCLVGYRKMQVIEEDHGRGPERTAIPTVVIGDTFAGHSYGQDAGNLVDWFMVECVGATAIEGRIYEENVGTWQLAERLGYELNRTSEEKGQGGSSRKVRHYVLFAEELKARIFDASAGYKLEVFE